MLTWRPLEQADSPVGQTGVKGDRGVGRLATPESAPIFCTTQGASVCGTVPSSGRHTDEG